MSKQLTKLDWYVAGDFSGEAAAICKETGTYFVDAPKALYVQTTLPNGTIRRVPICVSKVDDERTAACEEYRRKIMEGKSNEQSYQ